MAKGEKKEHMDDVIFTTLKKAMIDGMKYCIIFKGVSHFTGADPETPVWRIRTTRTLKECVWLKEGFITDRKLPYKISTIKERLELQEFIAEQKKEVKEQTARYNAK